MSIAFASGLQQIPSFLRRIFRSAFPATLLIFRGEPHPEQLAGMERVNGFEPSTITLAT